MADRLDPTFVRAQIALLRVTHPNIWDEGDDQLIADMLEGSTDLHEFLAAVVRRMVEATAFAAGIEAMIDQMKARRDRFNQRTEAMRGLALSIITAAQIKRLELPEATLSVVKPRERVVVANDADVPATYCHPPVVKPDLKKIKAALDAGERFNWASIQVGEPTLMVRIR
jgi:hypothetical protein